MTALGAYEFSFEDRSLAEDDSFLFTQLAWVLSSTSATISTVFSVAVMSFIFRSQDLSSSYHKIMLFMSFWDIISSLSTALGTIPMPSDVQNIYPFQGRSFGNAGTCTCQGFLIVVGGTFTAWANCTLNVYYVCTIRYHMTESTIKKRFLPIMLAIGTAHVCIVSYVLLSLNYFNPRPFEPFCLVGAYPHNCIYEEDVECIRGDVTWSTEQSMITWTISSMVFFLCCIVGSMVMVVWTVFRMEWRWRQDYNGRMVDEQRPRQPERREDDLSSPPPPTTTTSRREEDFCNTKKALHQALMYIAAFILTWVWIVIALLGGDKTWAANDPLKLIFQPLQGFFNAAIFFSYKVSLLRKANSRLTIFEACRQVIVTPSSIPRVLISQIAVLDEDEEASINSG